MITTAGAKLVKEGDRIQIGDAGVWMLVWEVKSGREAQRMLLGSSKSRARWRNIPNTEGIRVQSMGPVGWR